MADDSSNTLFKPHQLNFQCGVCHEVLSNPKSLKCLHNFCPQCLQKLKDSRTSRLIDPKQEVEKPGKDLRDNVEIQCPLCKDVTCEQEVKDNLVLLDFINQYDKFYREHIMNKAGGVDKVCQQCDKEKAVFFCKNCEVVLCDSCDKRHLKFKTFENHIISNIEDVEQDQDSRAITLTKICPLHPSHVIAAHCVPCATAVCSTCVLEQHNGHVTQSIEKALASILPLMKNKIEAIRKKQDFAVSLRAKVNDKIEASTASFREVLEQAAAVRDDTIHRAKEDYKALEDIIFTQASIKNAIITTQDLDNVISSQASLITWLYTVMEMSQGPGLLYELENELKSRIHAMMLEDLDCRDANDFLMEPSTAVFTPTVLKSNNLVGEISFVLHKISEEVKDDWFGNTSTDAPVKKRLAKTLDAATSRQVRDEIMKESRTMMTSKFHLPVKNASWPIESTITEEKYKTMPPTASTTFISTEVSSSPRNILLDLKQFSHYLTASKKVKCVKPEHRFERFVHHSDSIYAVCPYDRNKCIDIYDLQLNCTKSITCNGIDRPSCLVPFQDKNLQNNLMLIGGTNGLYIFNLDSKKIVEKLLDGQILDVHANKHIVAAIVGKDLKHTSVKLLKIGGKETVTVADILHSHANRVIILPDDDSTKADLNSEGRILVSDWDQHCLTEFKFYYGKQEEFILQKCNSYGHYGSSKNGDLNDPRICGIHGNSQVLVADSDNFRLQVLCISKHGGDGEKWLTIGKNVGEKYTNPTDVCVYGDQYIYVRDRNGVHMFDVKK